jgi:hypothetical protein
MNRILAVDSKALTGSADWLVPIAACSSRSTRTTRNRDALLRSAVVLRGEVGTELHGRDFNPARTTRSCSYCDDIDDPVEADTWMCTRYW